MRRVRRLTRTGLATLGVLAGGLVLMSTPAFAAAPEAPTLEVSGRTAESVSLNGVLSPNKVNEEGTYEVLYKKSATECTGGSHGIQGSVALPEQGQPVSETISGLEAGTKYTFCLVDTNTAAPHEKATSTPPLTVTTAIPVEKPEKAKVKTGSVTATTVEVEGELNHLKARASEPGAFEVLYKVSSLAAAPTGECEESTISDPTTGALEEAVTAKLAGLQPNAKYTFCLRARNEATPEGETSALTAPVTFDTPPAAPTIEPGTLKAKPKATSVTLEGTVNPNNEATECKFEYGTGEVSEKEIGCSPELLKGFGGQEVSSTRVNEQGQVTQSIGELTEDTVYKYRIVTKNGAGEKTEESTFTTAIPPTTPTTEAATGETASTATLHGVLNPTEAKSEAGNYQFFYKPSATECEITQSEREKGVAQLSTAETAATGKNQTVEATAEGLLPGTTYSVCLRALNGAGEAALGNAVSFTTLAVAPTVVPQSETAGEVSASGAKLEAAINPGGAATTYRLEYGPTTAYGTTLTGSVGAGAGVVQVEEKLQGLTPGTTYHYRFVAFNSQPGGAPGPDHTFTTQTAGGGFRLADNRAWEQVTPVNKHGAAIQAITREGGVIQAAVDGSALTYVAAGAAGEETQGNPALADTQLLSTRHAGQGWSTRDLAVPHQEAKGNFAGNLAEYVAFNPNLEDGIVEPHGNPPLSPTPSQKTVYLRENLREPASTQYTPLINNVNTPPGTNYGNQIYPYIVASSDLQHVILKSIGVSLTGATHGEGGGYYEWTAGVLTPVSVLPNEELAGAVNAQIGDADQNVRDALSTDGERVFWSYERGLYARVNASRPQSPLADGAAGGEGHRTGTDQLTNVAAATGAFQVGQQIEGIGIAPGSTITAVSGTTLTLSAATEEPSPFKFLERLYAYSPCTVPADACTVQLDLPHGVAPSRNPGAIFQYASPDGERVYFTDTQRLTGNATAEANAPELYEYDLATGGLRDLTANPNLAEPTSINVQGELIGAGENGEYVYFVADGALTPEAHAGEPNLYVEHIQGETITPRLVATLSRGDLQDWEGNRTSAALLPYVTSRVSPDGRFVAFMSELPLTGYDSTDAVSGVADEEVFVFDAGLGRLVCASCNPSGARPHGVLDPGESELNGYPEGLGLLVDRPRTWKGRWLAGSVPGYTALKEDQGDYQSRYLSDEGRLFFDSADALVPQDTNGKEDVYEYEPQGVGGCSESASSGSTTYVSGEDGCVALISSGTSSRESAFLDASESGDDVFFLTSAPLSPATDVDDAFDVYDARVCSGVSPCPGVLSGSPPCTTAESCKAAPSPQPSIFGSPASGTFSGAGNPPPAPAAVAKKKKPTPRCRKGFVRGKKDKCVRKKSRRAERAGKTNRGARR